MAEPKRVDFEKLADWVEGRLSEEEARLVEERVADADEATLADVEWLRALVSASEHIVLQAPPQEVRDAIERRFDRYAEGGREPGFVERLVATLSFEGGAQPAFGVRSAASQQAQGQLVYTTEAADIALNIHRRPGGGALDLDGQVFPVGGGEPGSFSVQILHGAEEVGIAATDTLGEFDFEGVAPGEYQIIISGEGVEILISPVQLSA